LGVAAEEGGMSRQEVEFVECQNHKECNSTDLAITIPDRESSLTSNDTFNQPHVPSATSSVRKNIHSPDTDSSEQSDSGTNNGVEVAKDTLPPTLDAAESFTQRANFTGTEEQEYTESVETLEIESITKDNPNERAAVDESDDFNEQRELDRVSPRQSLSPSHSLRLDSAAALNFADTMNQPSEPPGEPSASSLVETQEADEDDFFSTFHSDSITCSAAHHTAEELSFLESFAQAQQDAAECAASMAVGCETADPADMGSDTSILLSTDSLKMSKSSPDSTHQEQPVSAANDHQTTTTLQCGGDSKIDSDFSDAQSDASDSEEDNAHSDGIWEQEEASRITVGPDWVEFDYPIPATSPLPSSVSTSPASSTAHSPVNSPMRITSEKELEELENMIFSPYTEHTVTTIEELEKAFAMDESDAYTSRGSYGQRDKCHLSSYSKRYSAPPSTPFYPQLATPSSQVCTLSLPCLLLFNSCCTFVHSTGLFSLKPALKPPATHASTQSHITRPPPT
jgi:hypothetical protein